MAGQIKTTIKSIAGASFAARANSNHWTVLDAAPEDGGAGAATGPMEMVLNALGCCAAIDVLLILKKRRAQVEGLEMNISGDRADDYPRVFKKVHMEFVLAGSGFGAKDVQKAIDLSLQKYCSVAGMVSQTAEITTSFRIEA